MTELETLFLVVAMAVTFCGIVFDKDSLGDYVYRALFPILVILGFCVTWARL